MADWTLGTDAPTHLVEHNLFDHDGIATPTAGKVLGVSGGKYTQVDAPTGTDAAAIHDDTANEISALTEKGSPASGDLILIEDSAASYVKKKVQAGSLFDSLLSVAVLVATNTSLDSTHSTVIVSSDGATRTITLPAVSTVEGIAYLIKRNGTNGVVINRSGSDVIWTDGATATTKTLASDGGQLGLVGLSGTWYVVAERGTIS